MPRLRADYLKPLMKRLPPDAPNYQQRMERHDAAVAANRPGYRDPVTGLFAFTAECLAQRPCCGSGCRHCPWDT